MDSHRERQAAARAAGEREAKERSNDAIVHGTTACALCGDVLERGDSTLTWRERGSYAHRACVAACRSEENFAEEMDLLEVLVHAIAWHHTGPPELPGSREQAPHALGAPELLDSMRSASGTAWGENPEPRA